MESQQSDSDERLAVTPGSSSSTSVGYSGDDMSDTWSNVTCSINAENYITLTEGQHAALTVEELSEAIERCKELVFESVECSEERKWLVRRLVELRLRYEEAKEMAEHSSDVIEDKKVHLGHHFELKYEPVSTRKRFCDKCCGHIWPVVQSWYQCIDCRFKSHVKCVEKVKRVCAHLIYSENPHYEMNICPEKGLADQSYRCFECHSHISFKDEGREARLCDYSGKYYCPACHWNTPAIIPARAARHWDFQPRLISRPSAQFLKLTRLRPMLTLDPRLYGFVEELALVKKRREELFQMKLYIATCRGAQENSELIKEIEWRHHLVHNLEIFSLNDLIEINNGKMIAKVTQIHATLSQHIKHDCMVCQGRGYICELCGDNQILYPFDSNIHTCPKCGVVLHRLCRSSTECCPKCARKANRKPTENDEIQES